MIANPLNTASARLTLLASPRRHAHTALLAAITTLVVLLGVPATSLAAQGGVTVGAPAAKAKGAQAEAETPDPAERPRSVSKNQVRRAQTLLRVAATGSNDVKTRKIVKRFQTLRGIATHGVIDLPTYLQIKDAFALLETGGAGVELTPGPTDGTGGVSAAAAPEPQVILPPNLAPITPTEQAILDTIAQCESKGDPTATSANGLYRGKYQFDRATWKTVGGTGDPAAATEVEQDQRAAILLRQRGTAPWPICGRDAA